MVRLMVRFNDESLLTMCPDLFPWGQNISGRRFWWRGQVLVKEWSQEKGEMAPNLERREKSVQIVLRRRTLKLNAGH